MNESYNTFVYLYHLVRRLLTLNYLLIKNTKDEINIDINNTNRTTE